jgi:nucleoside 2-deoxyribosyltransferase
MIKIYLAGRMNLENPKEDWRNTFVKEFNQDRILDHKYQFIYPIDFNILRDIMDSNGYSHLENINNSIVNVDLKLIYNSDILLAYFENIPHPFIGSSMEILFAKQHHKFVFTIVNNQCDNSIKKHPFLNYSSDVLLYDDDFFTNSIKILEDVISEIA